MGLPMTKEIGGRGRGWCIPGRALCAGILALAGTLSALPPATVYEANKRLPARRAAVTQTWLNEYGGNWGNIGTWNTSASNCLRRIAGGLTAMKYNLPGAPPSTFPTTVENWIKANVYAHETVGSSGKSFDMTLIQIINLVMAFKDDPGLLTPTARNHLLGLRGSTTGALQPYMMGYGLTNMVFTTYGQSYPETENHVLMINIWQYLATQRAFELNLFPTTINRTVDNSSLEAGLLAVLGRIPQRGFFEANARPYQALTMHALITLYSYANGNSAAGMKVKTAAKNALDFAFLHYAFQSIESKRQGGQRRNWDDYRNSLGLTQGDYTSSMVAMLTGLNTFSDNWASLENQHRGYALWTAISAYRIPDPILDFFISPDNGKPWYGFWARMQSRYADAHYNKGSWSRYAVVRDPYLYHPAITLTGVTNGHGDPDLSGHNLEPALEFYFGTRHFLNAAGGHYDHFPALDLASQGDKVYIYDFFTKPSAILLPGNLTWGDFAGSLATTAISEGQGKTWRLPHTEGSLDWGCTWWPPSCGVYYQERTWYTDEPGYIQSNNIGTYKNVMLGYNTDRAKAPISIPAAWGAPVDGEVYDNTTNKKYRVDIYNPASVPGLSNHFVLVYRMTNNVEPENYNRAIMEIVPKWKFATAGAVLAKFRSYARAYNRYHTLVSDEDLVLNDQFGRAGVEMRSPFVSISKNGGSNQAVANHSDISSQTLVNQFPLIDVKQVDYNYNFTGVQYAYSSGDGYIAIHNPKFGYYAIDSRNFLVPSTTVPLANDKFDIVPTILSNILLF